MMWENEEVVRVVLSGLRFGDNRNLGPNRLSPPLFLICVCSLSDQAMIEPTILQYCISSVGCPIDIHRLSLSNLSPNQTYKLRFDSLYVSREINVDLVF